MLAYNRCLYVQAVLLPSIYDRLFKGCRIVIIISGQPFFSFFLQTAYAYITSTQKDFDA